MSGFDRLAGIASLASAVIAAAAVAFLVGMFAAFGAGAQDLGEVLGGTNDRLTLAAYLLAAPGVVATLRILRGAHPAMVTVGAAIALASLAAVAALQWLLVSGGLTFEEQIGPVSIAFLALGAWFVLTGWLGSRDGRLPYGVPIGVLAMLYVGYPVLAWRLGRALLPRSSRSAPGAVASDGGSAAM